MRRRLRGQAGFTLVELLVVIIILSLLVGLVGPRLFGHVGKSKQAAPARRSRSSAARWTPTGWTSAPIPTPRRGSSRS